MTYFKNCTTLNEVKAMYKTLAKQFHPDITGTDTTAIMQAINCEYAKAIKLAAIGGNLSSDEVEAEILNAENYRNAINAIINLQGITIELCGGWIWVNGNTYQHKAILKAAGFYFASVKKSWYFRSVEYTSNNKKTHTMQEIRTKYGSQLINAGSYSWNKFLAQ
jgi:hypothetical protein